MNSTRAIIRMPRSSIYPLATYEMDAFLHQARQPHDVRSRVCRKERRLRTCVGLRLLGLGLCLFPGRRIVTMPYYIYKAKKLMNYAEERDFLCYY